MTLRTTLPPTTELVELAAVPPGRWATRTTDGVIGQSPRASNQQDGTLFTDYLRPGPNRRLATAGKTKAVWQLHTWHQP